MNLITEWIAFAATWSLLKWIVFFSIIAFVITMFLLARKCKRRILDEREMMIRLKVHGFISRALEVILGACTIIYFFHQLNGFTVLCTIGLTGIFAQVFANYYYRRDECTLKKSDLSS